MTVSGVRICPARLHDLLQELFCAAGVTTADAWLLADTLVSADLQAVYSHGSARIGEYIARLREGGWDRAAVFEVIEETLGTALVDGNNGIGQITAARAMRLAIDKAERTGIAWVGVRGGGHFGTAAYYARMAAERDMIGIAMTNASVGIAPWGGTEPLLGNNPWSVAVPSAGEPPMIVLDMANSMSARGKIRLAAQRGEPIPRGWGLDRNGQPTTDPVEALKGTLAPIGGYKGYGITVMVDMLTGVLTGAARGVQVGSPRDAAQPQNVGQSFVALDLNVFGGAATYKERVAAFVAEIKNSPKRPGTDEILVPGEPEYRSQHRQLREGIGLPEEAVKEVRAAARSLDIVLPVELEEA